MPPTRIDCRTRWHLTAAEMQAVANNLFKPEATVTNNLPWVACVRLRIVHQVIRNQLDPANRDARRARSCLTRKTLRSSIKKTCSACS